jgi:hypothetical protein
MSQAITVVRRRRTPIALVGVLVLLAGVLLTGGTANAVHDTGAFQLDGNAQSSVPGGAVGDDWDRICYQATTSATICGTSTSASAAAASWTSEPNLNSSLFTGGGSKDPIDVSSWAWKDGAGGLPDKDNLLHSFAARYSVGNTENGASTGCAAGTTATTCEVLFFGSDRFDNSGDAQQGFWFFQNTVTLDSTKVGGGFGFKGVHKNGDVLVISDFSNGGSTASITVYQWDTTCTKAGGSCGDVNLRTLESSDSANCSSAGSGDAFCAIVNPSNGTASPWAFTDKSGNHTFLQGEFFEGGVNLSHLGLGDECFSSVMSETRSSQSTTAVLKDFVLGNFANCSATLATQVSSSSVNPGQQVRDTATVTGSSPTHTPTGNIKFFMCSFSANSTDACDDSDSAHHGTTLTVAAPLSGTTATATATSDYVNTVDNPLTPGRYCFRAEWPGDSNYTVDPSPLKEYSVATECFVVVQSSTTTETHPRLSGTTATVTEVNFGDSVVDYALIQGATGFGTPTGSVRFFVCNPTQTSGTAGNEVCPSTTGTAVGTTVTVSAVSNSDPPQSEATSAAVTANQLGVWCFRATYTPDTANYTGSADARHTECFKVTDTTDYTSAQKWLPNDSVTIASAHGAPVSGSLLIKLKKGSTCGAATTFYTETTITVSAAGTYNTTNGSDNATKYEVNASNADTYWWDVQFIPTNSNVTGFHTCKETSSVSIDNDAS